MNSQNSSNVAAAISTGWAYAAWRAELRLSEALPGEWEGRDVVVTGVVASLPQDFERGLRFVFEVEESAAPLPPKMTAVLFLKPIAAYPHQD